MVYRYGYFESAKRFCELIKIMLDEIKLASIIYDDNKIHHALVDKIADDIKQTINIDGSENIPLWGKTEI
ncbi:unnamed protein product [Rotaria sp. Silwood1]|nr:unnamed protein product [Rotaria sp. Silwood1]